MDKKVLIISNEKGETIRPTYVKSAKKVTFVKTLPRYFQSVQRQFVSSTRRQKMTRLIDADLLRKNMEFVCMGIMAETDPYDAPLTEIDNAPTVEERPKGEWKDIDIPKMCEECHSESYSNGFDAGYELGKEDAQKHIAELNESIEILKHRLEVYEHISNLGGEIETRGKEE